MRLYNHKTKQYDIVCDACNKKIKDKMIFISNKKMINGSNVRTKIVKMWIVGEHWHFHDKLKCKFQIYKIFL